jgi:hypothetical protein
MPAIAVREKRMSVRGLDGIALRVNNLDVMHQFYEEVIGLPQPWIPHRQGRMNEPSRGSEKVGLFPWDK